MSNFVAANICGYDMKLSEASHQKIILTSIRTLNNGIWLTLTYAEKRRICLISAGGVDDVIHNKLGMPSKQVQDNLHVQHIPKGRPKGNSG
jgi:hypothetical protein